MVARFKRPHAGPIPAGMDDSFTLGKPSRRTTRPRTARSRTPRSDAGTGRSGVGRVALLVVGGIVVVVAIAGFLTMTKNGGEQIAAGEQTAVSQIGAANDVDAKMTAQQTAVAVQQLYAEQGSFDAITPGALHNFEPSSSYTGGASTGPHVVSVSSSASGVGLAVRSVSGTCFFEHFSTSGLTYGTGTSTCTGQAAMSASATSWSA
jgi:hypothetical protein